MKWLGAIVVALVGSAAPAYDIGQSDFAFSSDLVARGFAPFAVSNSGNATYGLTNGSALYLCFIADTGEAQSERQRILLAEIAGENPARVVPNIPVVCILTQ